MMVEKIYIIACQIIYSYSNNLIELGVSMLSMNMLSSIGQIAYIILLCLLRQKA